MSVNVSRICAKMVSSRRGNKRPLLHEPEGASWMARTPPDLIHTKDALHKSAGRFLYIAFVECCQNLVYDLIEYDALSGGNFSE